MSYIDAYLAGNWSFDLWLYQKHRGISAVHHNIFAAVFIGLYVVISDKALFIGDYLTILLLGRCGTAGVEGS